MPILQTQNQYWGCTGKTRNHHGVPHQACQNGKTEMELVTNRSGYKRHSFHEFPGQGRYLHRGFGQVEVQELALEDHFGSVHQRLEVHPILHQLLVHVLIDFVHLLFVLLVFVVLQFLVELLRRVKHIDRFRDELWFGIQVLKKPNIRKLQILETGTKTGGLRCTPRESLSQPQENFFEGSARRQKTWREMEGRRPGWQPPGSRSGPIPGWEGWSHPSGMRLGSVVRTYYQESKMEFCY